VFAFSLVYDFSETNTGFSSVFLVVSFNKRLEMLNCSRGKKKRLLNIPDCEEQANQGQSIGHQME